MAFNKITDTLNVHQLRADRPIEDASTLKALYDQDVNTVKTRFNEHIDELSSTTSGSSGANNIGINAVGVVASNINDAVAEVQANVASAVAGDIPNNSLTELQMAADMKKQAGGVYPYDDGDQNATDIATNASNIQANADAIAEIEEIRVATDTTGSLNAYVLDTGNNFDFTLDGNVVRLNPNFTNTGTSTIAVDGTTKSIRKFDIDTDAYVILEAEDIKKNNPTELRFDVSEDFFVLAPKSGGAIKSIQSGVESISATTTNVTISTVGPNAIVRIEAVGRTGTNGQVVYYTPHGILTTATNLQITIPFYSTSYRPRVKWTVIEYNNVKSLQTGTTTATSTLNNITISAVDTNKVEVIVHSKGIAGTFITDALAFGYLSSSTNLVIDGGTGNSKDVYYQVLEFR